MFRTFLTILTNEKELITASILSQYQAVLQILINLTETAKPVLLEKVAKIVTLSSTVLTPEDKGILFA